MNRFGTIWSASGWLGVVILVVILASAAKVSGQEAPVLFFSDLTSGPRTGNTDSSGGRPPGQNGAIVTIWGRNLGSSQGESRVYCNGAEVASYYSWGDARSPADLFTYHKMQSVSFQVSSNAQDGAGSIYVVVSGQPSNTLPFTVRSGNIYFVKTTGDDSTGSGNWSNPWRTIGKAVGSLGNGDIAYIGEGVNQTAVTDFDSAVNLGSSGAAQNPKALVVYPGATSNVGNADIDRAFHIWDTDAGDYAQHWVVSKFTITTRQVGVFANTGFRVVGNRFTGPNTDVGVDGTLYAFGSDVYLLGNELHNIGTAQSGDSKLMHVIYVTGARRPGGPRLPTERNREIAWNYVHDNFINRGIDIYSEEDASAFIQQHRVHDNVITDQRGDGILMGYYVTGENWIYNNLIIRAGLGPEFDNPTYHTGIHLDTGHESIGRGSTVIHFYNNTLYGCGFSGAAYSGENGALLVTPEAISRSTLNFWNTIIRSTGDPYVAGESGSLASGSYRNCWYGDGAAPAWDTGAINADPQFVDAGADNFRLSSTSPCRDAGIDVSGIVSQDLDGTARPQGAGVDVGAYEYYDSVPVCRVSCTVTVPASGGVGDPISFQASATLVDCPGGTVSYSWDFGDGTTSSDQSPTHSYAAGGSYRWSLAATAPGAVACDRSGTIVSTPGGVVNDPPTADAGPDQTVQEGSPGTLDGTASFDPEGAVLGFAWTQTAGPSVALSESLSSAPSFTTPWVAADTTLTFQLIVNDGAWDSAPDTIAVLVRDRVPLTVTTPALPKGEVGSAYAQELQASGGPSPYAWSLAKGKLPVGLTLEESGALNGTPTIAGRARFTVRGTDASGASAGKKLALKIVKPVRLTTKSLPKGKVGRPYSATLAVSGGIPPLTFTLVSGSLPPGLALDPATGRITETPAAAGVFGFRVRVTSSGGSDDQKDMTLAVKP